MGRQKRGQQKQKRKQGDENRRSWYRLEEVVRAYVAKYPCCLRDPEQDAYEERISREGFAGRKPLVKPAAVLGPVAALMELPQDELQDELLVRAVSEDNRLEDKDPQLVHLKAVIAEQEQK